MRFRPVVSLGISLAMIAVAAWIFINRQFVYDQIIVWQFQPSSAVLALADRAQLSDKAKFHYLASQPSLSDRAEFTAHCQSHEKQTVVLGCYANHRIYVFDVSDARLDGIREVTAAHEMLHAAYVRLSDEERVRVDRLLAAELTKINDPDLKKRLEYYAKTEPGQQYNELHSIFGTEISSLGAELSAYYDQYFKDRPVVVALSKKYSDVFGQLESQQNALVARLNALAKDATARIEAFNRSAAELSSDIASFNRRASIAGSFSSQAAFDRERSQLVARQQALEYEQSIINKKIATYNQTKKQYDELSLRAKDLQKSIDSRLTPLPSL